MPLQPGVNVLIGRNGTGKTNLVEALGYLATLSSHRVATDAPLIRRGADRAVVRAAVVSDDRELLLEIEINNGRANRARINRAPLTRARDLLGVLRTVLFAPEDLALVRGDPAERRRFTDDVLIMRAPRMAGVRADYDRVLKQRNALLKTAGLARRGGGELATLDVWDEHLATAGAELVHARLALIAELRPHVAAAYADLAGAGDAVGLVYRGTVPIPDGDQEPARRDRCDPGTRSDARDRRAAGLDAGRADPGPAERARPRHLAGRPAPRRPRAGARQRPGQGVRLARRVVVVRAGPAAGLVRAAAQRRGRPDPGAGRRLRRAGHHPPGPAGRAGRRRRTGGDDGRGARRRARGAGRGPALGHRPGSDVRGA